MAAAVAPREDARADAVKIGLHDGVESESCHRAEVALLQSALDATPEEGKVCDIVFEASSCRLLLSHPQRK